jgi:hypothetical protein
MNVDRPAARKRVKVITAGAAAGAAALTAGFAFGANRDSSGAAKASVGTATREPAYTAPRDATPQLAGSGFLPPRASSEPPQAMSGGS